MPTSTENGKNVVEEGDNSNDIDTNGTESEADLAIVADVLSRFGLDALEENRRLQALCIIFKQAVDENVVLKSERRALRSQLESSSSTVSTLQKLVSALRQQSTLVKEECEVRVKAETQKRIESATQFESSMQEISKLLTTHAEHNKKLKEENEKLTETLRAVTKECESRERLATEKMLELELATTQNAKLKLEKAEMKAEGAQERLGSHKRLLDMEENNEKLRKQLRELAEEQLLAQEQRERLEENARKGGISNNDYLKEMERLGRGLRGMEREMKEWKHKFDEAKIQVARMNESAAEKEREMQALQRKLDVMQELNRTLIAKQKEVGVSCDGKEKDTDKDEQKGEDKGNEKESKDTSDAGEGQEIKDDQEGKTKELQ